MTPRVTRTEAIAHSASIDAGNRSMRRGGRAKWNSDDFMVALAEYDRLWPEGRGPDIRLPARRNPATLAVWGNPPGELRKGAETTLYVDQQIGFRVHDIRYEHVDDREYYKHTFASGVEMWSVLRGDRASTRHQHQDVLLTRPDGKSLWDDF